MDIGIQARKDALQRAINHRREHKALGIAAEAQVRDFIKRTAGWQYGLNCKFGHWESLVYEAHGTDFPHPDKWAIATDAFREALRDIELEQSRFQHKLRRVRDICRYLNLQEAGAMIETVDANAKSSGSKESGHCEMEE